MSDTNGNGNGNGHAPERAFLTETTRASTLTGLLLYTAMRREHHIHASTMVMPRRPRRFEVA